MIRCILITAFAFCANYVLACKCGHHSFKEESVSSDQIFIGKVIYKTESDKVYYHFLVTENFKGEKTDTITIQTGYGGPDCGMEFLIGKEYLVYAKQKRTSRCQRNALTLNNPDVELLRKHFASRF
jgi:hypothetical protein